MEGMWYACEVIFLLVVGMCIYQEYKLITEWLERRRQRTKSRLRIVCGEIVGRKNGGTR